MTCEPYAVYVLAYAENRAGLRGGIKIDRSRARAMIERLAKLAKYYSC